MSGEPRGGDRPARAAQRHRRWALLLAVVAAGLVSGCGDDDGNASGSSTAAVPRDPAGVVSAAWEAWSAADEDAFFALVADDAIWFGSSVASEAGRTAMEYSWGLNTTMQASFADRACVETGDIEAVSQGSVVECTALFSDLRHEAFSVEPARVTGRYAVADGRIVNAMAFDPGTTPEWARFLETFLGNNHGAEMNAACSGSEASGQSCALVILAHVDQAAAAWAEE